MIKSVHDSNEHTMMFEAMGKLTYIEMHAEVLKFSTHAPASKVLFDLTQGTASNLNSQEIEGLLETIGQELEGGNGGKAAIVAPSTVDNGLARLFGTFVEVANLPVEVKVFQSSDVARQWLQE